jgi:DNA-binding SARP family transcriptional activator
MLGPDTTAAPLEAGSVAPLTLRLFGPFEARLHGQALPRLHSRKGQWLLALLTLRHGCEVSRAWLAGTLWPDSPEEAAYASLRNSLKDLRRALGTEAGRLRAPTPRTLALDLQEVDADVLAFDQAIAQGEEGALELAVHLCRGPLLEGCVEEWVLPERHTREQACLAALETLAARALERGDPSAAERHLRQAVTLDPLRETAQRALMQALATAGSYAAAVQVYRELRLRLHRELTTAPDPETQLLYQQLRTEARRKAATGRVSDGAVGDGATGGRGDGAKKQDQLRRPLAPSPHPPLASLGRVPGPVAESAPSLPAGTVTFLFTAIEGSTPLWEHHPATPAS